MSAAPILRSYSFLVLATALLAPSLARADRGGMGGQPPFTELADLSVTTLIVGGMHCAGCSLKIRKALLSLKGVKSLEEGETKKHLVVRYVPGKVTPADLVKTVEELGYHAKIAK